MSFLRTTFRSAPFLAALLFAAACSSSSDDGPLFADPDAGDQVDGAPDPGRDGGPGPGPGHDAGDAKAQPDAPGTDGNPASCGTGFTTCGSECVDLKSDPLHCGGCDVACVVPGGGTATCSDFQCGVACDTGKHACSGACVSNTSVATCGASCTPCTSPFAGTPTCDGTSCGAVCNSGYHFCSGQCVLDVSAATCGTSCTPCAAPLNATATCNGATCDFTCSTGFHRCGGACVDGTSVTQCGASCTPCTAAPANASPTCNGTSCDFVCNAGFQRVGGACVAVPTPTLAIAPTALGTSSNTFHLDAALTTSRLGSFDTCPNATLGTTITSYQFVQITNPTAQTATVSIWSSKAATAGAVDIDTIMASYATQPTTDAQRMACAVGVDDECTETIVANECVGEWAGLTKTDTRAVTIPPLGSVVVYVAAYWAASSTQATAGDYMLTARTETLN